MSHLTGGVAVLLEAGPVVAVSSIWETEAVGGQDQDDYLNAVAVIDTVVGPFPLLELCLGAEREAGRVHRERWGPRTLDLDILLYGDAVIDAPGLSVPHLRMTERRFVLEPLVEAWPNVAIPGAEGAAELLVAVSDQVVRRLEGAWWEVS